MYQLSDEQVTYILNDIRRNGVEMEDLQLNLLDHICCIIEQNLEEGDDFETLYRQTVAQFYKTELKEIETETIHLLTFKNYYVMKKLMMVSGTFSAFILLIGSIFKIMHWPGAGVLLVSGITSFSLIFLPALFVLKVKELESANDKWILGLGVAVGSLMCLAAMFKVMHWPGANIMWVIGLAVSFLLLLPIYFLNGISQPEKKLNTIVTTIILVGVLGVLLTITQIGKRPVETAYQQDNTPAANR